MQNSIMCLNSLTLRELEHYVENNLPLKLLPKLYLEVADGKVLLKAEER